MQDRHIGTRSGVQDTLCEASGGGGQLTLRELMGIAAALEIRFDRMVRGHGDDQ